MKITYKQALEASISLMELNKLNLPIRTGIAIARLSNLIDGELRLFAIERDKLVKTYKIIPSHTEDENILSFATNAKGEGGEEEKSLKMEVLREFTTKFQDLLETETPDWDIGLIPLPENIEFKPKLLKAIVDFVEVA